MTRQFVYRKNKDIEEKDYDPQVTNFWVYDEDNNLIGAFNTRLDLKNFADNNNAILTEIK